MIVHAKILKFGNSLGIRLSGALRTIPNFTEGMPIDVEVSEDSLIITRAKPKPVQKLPFTEEELLKDISPESAHADIIAPPLKGEY